MESTAATIVRTATSMAATPSSIRARSSSLNAGARRIPKDIQDLEQGIASSSVERLRVQTEHFGVRDDDIDLAPHRPPSRGEWLGDALTP